MRQIFNGVYKINGKLATENLAPGFRVYDEKLIRQGNKEYRIWDPLRSKLAAAIENGLKEFPLSRNSNVLYLGASSGTTASHISDICSDGLVYCIESSKRMMRELIPVTIKKTNMIPILADARRPREYSGKMGGIDFIYQDVAQPNQAEILLRNSEEFMPRNAMLAIKSRSISSVRKPKEIFGEETEKLKDKFQILQIIDLRPYDKDHVLVNLKVR